MKIRPRKEAMTVLMNPGASEKKGGELGMEMGSNEVMRVRLVPVSL